MFCYESMCFLPDEEEKDNFVLFCAERRFCGDSKKKLVTVKCLWEMIYEKFQMSREKLPWVDLFGF